MYDHEIKNQIDFLKEKGLVKEEDAQKSVEALKEYWNDKIAIVWNTEDVLSRAEELEIEITEDDARNILGTLLNDFDANYGINWSAIDVELEEHIKTDD
jgi:hypothetical protein